MFLTSRAAPWVAELAFVSRLVSVGCSPLPDLATGAARSVAGGMLKLSTAAVPFELSILPRLIVPGSPTPAPFLLTL